MSEYSKSKDFSNYLLYIFNNKCFDLEIRQISGLTLKGLLDTSFESLPHDALSYFKGHVFDQYLCKNKKISCVISSLVNSFVKYSGIEAWPELPNYLYNMLLDGDTIMLALETIKIIIEDVGEYYEEEAHIEVYL